MAPDAQPHQSVIVSQILLHGSLNCLAANYGASVFWALLYEALGSRQRTRPRALRDAAAAAAIAYVVDYHVVPKRLTPGFELRIPSKALAAIYAALAVGLSLRDLYGGSGK